MTAQLHFLQGKENKKVYEIDGKTTTFVAALQIGHEVIKKAGYKKIGAVAGRMAGC